MFKTYFLSPKKKKWTTPQSFHLLSRTLSETKPAFGLPWLQEYQFDKVISSEHSTRLTRQSFKKDANMVTIRNRTPKELVIIDHYLTDVKLNIGYDGVIEHRIAANGKKSISSAEYVNQCMEERKSQQIHVRSGTDETKLVLHQNNLKDNKEVVFKMQGDSITASYSPKTATTYAERIRRMFPSCGSGGLKGESPVTPRVTSGSNSAARIVVAEGGASDSKR